MYFSNNTSDFQDFPWALPLGNFLEHPCPPYQHGHNNVDDVVVGACVGLAPRDYIKDPCCHTKYGPKHAQTDQADAAACKEQKQEDKNNKLFVILISPRVAERTIYRGKNHVQHATDPCPTES